MDFYFMPHFSFAFLFHAMLGRIAQSFGLGRVDAFCFMRRSILFGLH